MKQATIDWEKYQIVPAIFWMVFSIFVVVFAFRLGFGTFGSPGPGFVPFLLGLALFLVSCGLFLTCIFKKAREHKIDDEQECQISLGKLICMVITLFVYSLVMEIVGFPLGTFLLIGILFKIMGSRKWSYILGGSAFVAVVTHVMFTALGVRLPLGVLGFLDLY